MNEITYVARSFSKLSWLVLEEDALDDFGDPDVDNEDNSESIHDLEMIGEHGIKYHRFRVFVQK